MAIKTNLHLLLAEKRMSQKELSEQTGIRPNTISAYYNDNWKTISKEHIDILCKFFNCSISDLIEYDPMNVKIFRGDKPYKNE